LQAGGHVAAGKTLTSEQSYADRHKEAEFQERPVAGTFCSGVQGQGVLRQARESAGSVVVMMMNGSMYLRDDHHH
jgi:hypothetical protein